MVNADPGFISHLFLWLELRWSSTARQHRLLEDHQGWGHLVMPGLIAALCGSARLGTTYLEYKTWQRKKEGENRGVAVGQQSQHIMHYN